MRGHGQLNNSYYDNNYYDYYNHLLLPHNHDLACKHNDSKLLSKLQFHGQFIIMFLSLGIFCKSFYIALSKIVIIIIIMGIGVIATMQFHVHNNVNSRNILQVIVPQRLASLTSANV